MQRAEGRGKERDWRYPSVPCSSGHTGVSFVACRRVPGGLPICAGALPIARRGDPLWRPWILLERLGVLPVLDWLHRR